MEVPDSLEVIGPHLLEGLNLGLPVGNISRGHEVLELNEDRVLNLDCL